MIVAVNGHVFDFSEGRYLARVDGAQKTLKDTFEWIEIERRSSVDMMTGEVHIGWYVVEHQITRRPRANGTEIEQAYQQWLMAEVFEK